jgi:glycerol kinase
MGSGLAAGLAVGLWKDKKDLLSSWKSDRKFSAAMKDAERKRLTQKWEKALKRLLLKD